MELTLYQADAFTDEVFGGNPAAICPLTEWLEDELLQKIAVENNLSETAFLIREKDDFHLRWFTPAYEVDLCGHATLAAAHILFNHLGHDRPAIIFHTRSGALTVQRHAGGYLMDFPADTVRPVAAPEGLSSALGAEPNALYRGKTDYLIILDSQEAIEKLRPNFFLLGQIPDSRGFIATAPGNAVDFVSRCFYPAAGINEDPVTGSAHTTSTPYWAKRLDKTDLRAVQLSSRKGHLQCRLRGDRVELIGNAVTYLVGKIYL